MGTTSILLWTVQHKLPNPQSNSLSSLSWGGRTLFLLTHDLFNKIKLPYLLSFFFFFQLFIMTITTTFSPAEVTVVFVLGMFL